MAIVRPTFFVVRSANFFAPSSVNSRLTTFWPFCWFVAACASLRSVPVSTVLPSSSLNSSMAVLPMVLMAASGSLTPGSSMMTRRSPSRWMIGSVRPSALTRFSMMVTTRFIASSLTFATSVSSASSTTCVPPCRSRPWRMELARGWTNARNKPTIATMQTMSLMRLFFLNVSQPFLRGLCIWFNPTRFRQDQIDFRIMRFHRDARDDLAVEGQCGAVGLRRLLHEVAVVVAAAEAEPLPRR